MSVFKFMSVKINYQTALFKKKSSNLVLFIDENFNITDLKKFFSSGEYSFVEDLLKIIDKKKRYICL